MIEGYIYLHTNGRLIYKRNLDSTAADLRESTFVRAFWPVDPTKRDGAWRILVEASASDAYNGDVVELAEKWGCTDEDAQKYAEFEDFKLFMDGDHWCATRKDFVDIHESPCGFGKTALEAISNLCKALQYRPRKMWGQNFSDLLKM